MLLAATKPSLCTSRIYYCLSLWQVGEVSLLKKIDPHFMNMMKNANNTTKTKLLTSAREELRDGNENIAITNRSPPPRPRGAPRPCEPWGGLKSGGTQVSPPGPLPILPALKEERGEKRGASQVLNPTRISLLDGCPFVPASLRGAGERSRC